MHTEKERDTSEQCVHQQKYTRCVCVCVFVCGYLLGVSVECTGRCRFTGRHMAKKKERERGQIFTRNRFREISHFASQPALLSGLVWFFICELRNEHSVLLFCATLFSLALFFAVNGDENGLSEMRDACSVLVCQLASNRLLNCQWNLPFPFLSH